MSTEDPQEYQRRMEDTELTSANIQEAMGRQRQKGPSEQGELVELLTEKDLQSTLPDDSYQLLENLISKVFPLSNFDSAQVHEYRHRMWVARRKFYDMHPSEGDYFVGAGRVWLHGNDDAWLEPLTQQQKFAVDTVFKNAEAAITPAEDFAQQEMFSTSISESHVVRDQTEEGGGILDRLS